VLAADERVARCLTTRVLTWAAGREVTEEDPAFAPALAALADAGETLPALLAQVATSSLLTDHHGEPVSDSDVVGR
jgi:hypothetical protein